MKKEYIAITHEEFDDIINAGYEYPNVYVDGNGDCYCEELLYDMYESKMIGFCEVI